jgi:uncharacterized protein (TIGR02246 family)
MAAQRPEDLHPLFAEAFSSGDLEGITGLYEKSAVFLLDRSGRLAKGANEIREVYRPMFAGKAKMEVETRKIVQAEELALMIGRWTITASGADGNALMRSGVGADVARRQPDGTWLIAIDNPYGGE